jgi:hypothetical protein
MTANNKSRFISYSKNIIFLWVLLIFFVSCNNYYEIKLEKKNPTVYCFNANPQEVKKAAIRKFDNFKDLDLVLKNEYKYQTEINSILNKKGNENDLYLETYGNCLISKVYFNDGKPSLFEVEFHVHLDSLSENMTQVTINTLRSEVLTGSKIGISDNLVLGQPNTEKVPPSTIEEYEILLAIGEELGQKGMPPCHYPPKNAKKTLKICSTIW